jgi:hypothetical protein
MRSSFRSIGLAALVLSFASVAGCFQSAGPDELSCTQDKYCPSGYVCVGVQIGRPGKCQPQSDAGGNPGPADGARPLDGNGPGTVDMAIDSQAFDLRVAIDQRTIDAAPDSTALASTDVEMDGAQRPVTIDATGDFPVDVGTVYDLGVSPDIPSLPPEAGPEAGPEAHPETAADGPSDLPPALPVGSTCSNSTDCAANVCSDGVCCNVPCAGACQSCALPDRVGTCSFVTGSPAVGHSTCGGNALCAGSCNGRSASCVYPDSSTSCASPSCGSGSAQSARSCDGAGNCSPAQTALCAPYVCGATACLTTCTDSSHCAASAVCIGGTCTPCPTGQTACNGTCADLKTDNAHCGSCTGTCTTSQQCAGGQCLLGRNQPCNSTAECGLGTCMVYYYDADRDGVPGHTSQGFCLKSVDSPPQYYWTAPSTPSKWDCCDSDINVKPGQSQYFTTVSACGTWDYNCDGSMQKSDLRVTTCASDGAGGCTAKNSMGTPSTDCGTPNIYGSDCALDPALPGTCSFQSWTTDTNLVACH